MIHNRCDQVFRVWHRYTDLIQDPRFFIVGCGILQHMALRSPVAQHGGWVPREWLYFGYGAGYIFGDRQRFCCFRRRNRQHFADVDFLISANRMNRTPVLLRRFRLVGESKETGSRDELLRPSSFGAADRYRYSVDNAFTGCPSFGDRFTYGFGQSSQNRYQLRPSRFGQACAWTARSSSTTAAVDTVFFGSIGFHLRQAFQI